MDDAMVRDIERRLAKAESLGEQMLQELYGLHGQDGIRTEIKLLRQDHEDQRRETKQSNNEMREDMERLATAITDVARKYTPRWVMVLYLTVFAVCAVITAMATVRAGM